MSASAPYPVGTILHFARTITPLAFEERVARDLRVCSSTGKSVSIAYNTFGDPMHPLVLLVPGLNCQGPLNYDTAMCTWLAAQGLYVVRMDNRDVGLSTTFDDVPQSVAILKYLLPESLAFGEQIPYSLDDMADDCVALIKYLVEPRHLSSPDDSQSAGTACARKVHIVGCSMGGMIAQCIGLRCPQLVASLTLVMTTSGNPRVQGPSWGVLLSFLKKPKSNSVEDQNAYRRDYIRNTLGPDPSCLDDPVLIDLVEAEITRSTYGEGRVRQLGAISRAPVRDLFLGRLASIPVHVMHGERDRLIPVANGRHLHSLIPNSVLSTYPSMAHCFDYKSIQQFSEDMVAFIRKHGGGVSASISKV